MDFDPEQLSLFDFDYAETQYQKKIVWRYHNDN